MLPHLAQLEIRETGQWVEWHVAWILEYAPLYLWLAWRAVRGMTVDSEP